MRSLKSRVSPLWEQTASPQRATDGREEHIHTRVYTRVYTHSHTPLVNLEPAARPRRSRDAARPFIGSGPAGEGAPGCVM